MEDCPVCLDPFYSADLIYPLICPTPGCHFNFCANCIRRLERAAADGYQEASDGSNQMRVQVQCPQCREKYGYSKYPSEIIIRSILVLREAITLESSLVAGDSILSAKQLTEKNIFIKSTTLEELQDSCRRLEEYYREIGEETPVPPLDWDLWRSHVSATSGGRTSLTNSNQVAWNDPTLFYGLDELMTRDEQEYVTQLFTQGEAKMLTQGAQILHGILDMAANRTVAQLSSFGTSGRVTPKADPVDPAVLQRIRRKYPLPSRMPRCVRMAVYDVTSRMKPLYFPRNGELSLTQVRGTAGRLGLRKGDVVTHVNGEEVSSVSHFEMALRQNCDTDDTFWLNVNCDDEIAKALKTRYEKMMQDKVHFRKL